MIKIYLAKIPGQYEEDIFHKYCGRVDSERLSRVLRIGSDLGRMRSLLAGYLLQTGVKEQLGLKGEQPIELQYRYGENGKPYLSNYPFFFNISHSDAYVVCGVADQEIGVDIQKEKSVQERLAKRFFTREEYAELMKCTEDSAKQELFFRLWTIKESYIKLSGLGLRQGLDTFRIDTDKSNIMDISGDGNAWFREWMPEKGVHLAISMYEPFEPEQVIFCWK